MLRFHHQRFSLRPVSRPARQGAGLSPGLDTAGAAGIHQAAVRLAGPTAAAGSRGEREHRARFVQGIRHRRTNSSADSREHFSVRQTYCTASARKPDVGCIWAWSRSRSACWKPRRKRCGFSSGCATSIPNDRRLDEFLGVNYDTCHLAVEFENPAEALARLRRTASRSANCISARP